MDKSEKQISILDSFRKAFTWILILNLILLIERSIFDFLGFMYGMILADIIYSLFLIIGLFGAYQYRVNYVAASTLLSLIWIGWNIFVICVYLNVGFLNRYEPFVLSLNTDKKSWWFVNSVSCSQHLEKYQYENNLAQIKSILLPDQNQLKNLQSKNLNEFETNASSFNLNSPMSTLIFAFNNNNNETILLDNFVQSNCVLPFYTIEIIHSGFLIFVGILTVIFGLLLSNSFNDENDTFDYIGGFDSILAVPSTNTQIGDRQLNIPINGNIRLEPLYERQIKLENRNGLFTQQSR